MSRVAIIPARGGSKRLPRKNIIDILGKPALHYPLKVAADCGLFDHLIVSTDDREIGRIALECGAEVFERPDRLSTDTAGVKDVCVDVLQKLNQQGEHPEWFCCLYATAVFIRPEDLNGSFQLFKTYPDVRVVMGVSEYNLQPAQAMSESDGFLAPRWPDLVTRRSQETGRMVASNGTIYWAKTRTFLEEKTFYIKQMKGYEIPWIRAIDLDTPEDLDTARFLAPLFLT